MLDQASHILIKIDPQADASQKAESTIPYKDIKERLEQHLKHEKIQKEITLYVEQLKEKAKVEIFPTDDP